MSFIYDPTAHINTGDRRSPMGSRRAAELAKRVDNEKWVRLTLASASINAKVFLGSVYVTNETDMLRAKAAIHANIALTMIPIIIKP